MLVTQTTGYLWLLDFGVRESVIKYVAEFNEKKDFSFLNEILGSAIRIYSIICVACIIFSAILSLVFPYLFNVVKENAITAQLVVIVTGIDIAQAFFFNIFTGIVMGFQRYDIFSKINIGFSVVRAIITIIFLSHGYGIVALSIIQLSFNLLTNIIIYHSSRKLLPIKIFALKKIDKSTKAKRLILNYSFFVLLNNLSLQAIFYSSNIIIAAFLPISYVTFYAISSNLIEYLKKLIFTGTQVFAPLTSQLDAKNDPETIAKLLINGSKYSLLLCLPVSIVYILLGNQFISLWMGAEYSEISGTILSILSISIIFSAPHYTMQGILFGLNKHNVLAYVRTIESTINIALSIFLVKKYGVIGVALGAAIPHLATVILVLPALTANIVKLKLVRLLKQAYISPILSAIPFTIAICLTKNFFTPISLLSFFCEIATLMIIYLFSIAIISLNHDQRSFIREKAFASLIPIFRRN